jgi:hypothetical protein
MNDLARLAARARKSGVDREIVQTLAAVCAPRVRPDVPQADRAAGPVTLGFPRAPRRNNRRAAV